MTKVKLSPANLIQLCEHILESTLPLNEAHREFSLADVHAPGMFSLVVDGTEPGKLTRIFIAQKKLKPFAVQLHTHRYELNITMIKGNITHHTAQIDGKRGHRMSLYKYHSPLNGGEGLVFDNVVRVALNSYSFPPGSTIKLTPDDFHTMSVSKGSMWIVEERGFTREHSYVLGVPFITDDLYTKPRMYQINDMIQRVRKELQLILKAHLI